MTFEGIEIAYCFLVCCFQSLQTRVSFAIKLGTTFMTWCQIGRRFRTGHTMTKGVETVGMALQCSPSTEEISWNFSPQGTRTRRKRIKRSRFPQKDYK